jgi:hypothetical protein
MNSNMNLGKQEIMNEVRGQQSSQKKYVNAPKRQEIRKSSEDNRIDVHQIQESHSHMFIQKEII